MKKIIKRDLIYPQLSYKIIGCLFEVFKNIGSGHREKYYQNAVKNELTRNKILFREQVNSPLMFKDSIVGKNFLDFLIDEKVVLEIKIGSYFKKQHLNQVLEYLKTNNLKLGIIAIFTNNGVKYYRVINIE